MFSVNILGILCSRSLHYQFYTWYYYSLPFFICYGQLTVLRLLLFLGIEWVYMTYPPTWISSLSLQLFHLLLVLRVWLVVEKTTPAAHLQRPLKVD